MFRSFTVKLPLFRATPGLTEYESVIIANGLPAALKALDRVIDSGVVVPPEVLLTVQLCAGNYGAQTLVIIGDGSGSTSISLRFHPNSVSVKTNAILEATGFVRIFEAGDPVDEWVWLP